MTNSKPLSTAFRDVSVGIFFIVLSFCIISLTQFSKTFLTQTKTETLALVNKQTNLLRQDTFLQLDTVTKTLDRRLEVTADRLDTRLGSVQQDLNVRLASLESKADTHLTTIENRAFVSLDGLDSNLTKVADESILLSKDYRKVPAYLTLFDEQLDCKNNDFCWQNLTTDTLISVRNVSVDANKTFLTINENVPVWTQDFNKISSSISLGLPRIVDHSASIAGNIDRMTKKRWYDRLLSGAISGVITYGSLK